MKRFADRVEAGKRLASALLYLKGKDAIVLAIPRGGILVMSRQSSLEEAALTLPWNTSQK